MKKFLKMIVHKMDSSRDLTFLIILFICIISMLIAVYAQFFYKYSSTDALMLGINVGNTKTEEEYAELRNSFENLFTNEFKIDSNQDMSKVSKIKQEVQLVFTNYDLSQKSEENFEINAKIPAININTDLAKAINNEIKIKFYHKISQIINDKSFYTNYNVSYISYCNQGVLSIAIKANLKEGSNPERVIIETYNYNIENNQLITLSDIIVSKNKKEKEVQNAIEKEIKKSASNAKALSEYYDAYQRNVNDEIYKIEKSNQFLVTQDGYVYVIYAYGNNENTNEMDIVIF